MKMTFEKNIGQTVKAQRKFREKEDPYRFNWKAN